VVAGLGEFMRDDPVGDEFAACATMARKVAVEGPAALRIVPYRREGRLAECPLKVWAALLGMPATPADGTRVGHSRHQSAGGRQLPGLLEARNRSDCIDDGQGQDLPQAWNWQHTVKRRALLHGRHELGLEGVDRLGVAIAPLPFVLPMEAHQGMGNPALDVRLRGLLDVVARMLQQAVTQEQATEAPLFGAAQGYQAGTLAQAVSERVGLLGVEIRLGPQPSLEELGQGQRIPAICCHFRPRAHRETHRMRPADVRAGLLEAIDEPGPVKGALDNDSQAPFEGLDQLSERGKIMADLLLDEAGEVLIDPTHWAISCAAIPSAVERHRRPPCCGQAWSLSEMPLTTIRRQRGRL
jgi:hypothetical protein